jgi:hypothetical protein
MRRTEIVVASVFLLLGVHVLQQSTTLSYSEKFGPGAGFLPFWLGVAWIILALIHLGNVLLHRHQFSGPHPFPPRQAIIRVGCAFAILLATVWVMGRFGLPIALALMVLAFLRGIEGQRWRSAIVAAVSISLAVYLLFGTFLSVPFPAGPFGS